MKKAAWIAAAVLMPSLTSYAAADKPTTAVATPMRDDFLAVLSIGQTVTLEETEFGYVLSLTREKEPVLGGDGFLHPHPKVVEVGADYVTLEVSGSRRRGGEQPILDAVLIHRRIPLHSIAAIDRIAGPRPGRTQQPSKTNSNYKLHDLITLIADPPTTSKLDEITVEIIHVSSAGLVVFEGHRKLSSGGRTLTAKVRGKVPMDSISSDNKVHRRDVTDYQLEVLE